MVILEATDTWDCYMALWQQQKPITPEDMGFPDPIPSSLHRISHLVWPSSIVTEAAVPLPLRHNRDSPWSGESPQVVRQETFGRVIYRAWVITPTSPGIGRCQWDTTGL